jgi:hypothetical protein
MHKYIGTALALLAPAGFAAADEPKTSPLPTPLTRPAMKQALEDLKGRTPRIPLPALTEADRAALGDRADSYESRLRHHYLSGDESRRGARAGGGPGGRESDPNMTLGSEFKTRLFWIVSRTNNCLY